MAVTRKKKEQILAGLVKQMQEARAMVFAKYTGVSVKNISALRGKLRASNVAYKVAKKSLIQMAAQQAGLKEIPDEYLQGPIGVGFAKEDEVAAARILNDFAKAVGGVELLGGMVEGNLLNKAQVKVLAELPGREVLLAKLVGTMKAPISGLHAVLHGVMRNFVGVVKAYHDQKAAQ